MAHAEPFMKHSPADHPAPFGAVLGIGPGGVAVYSSDYDTVDREELPTRQAFRSYVDGVYMGHKWQCVELARRWMYVNCGYVFDDIAMAYDIFSLRHVRRIEDGALLPLRSFRNGGMRPLEPGALIIWNEGGEFEVTGHVAVVTEATADRVRIIEQNVEDTFWPDGQTWSRELPLGRTAGGGWRLAARLHDPRRGNSRLGDPDRRCVPRRDDRGPGPRAVRAGPPRCEDRSRKQGTMA